jgi:catechol 2,3-dioxygenase-like lactoylglutathione lyase family enzyme
MKRFHVHVAVDDLDRSIAFYTGLFGAPPAVAERDYAKWMLDDPRLNFAISARGARSGLDHFGLQVDSRDELEAVQRQLDAAGLATFARGATTCCYAESQKTWTVDPQGLAWETFLTTGRATTYGDERTGEVESQRRVRGAEPAAACCGPARDEAAPGCAPAEGAGACC